MKNSLAITFTLTLTFAAFAVAPFVNVKTVEPPPLDDLIEMSKIDLAKMINKYAFVANKNAEEAKRQAAEAKRSASNDQFFREQNASNNRVMLSYLSVIKKTTEALGKDVSPDEKTRTFFFAILASHNIKPKDVPYEIRKSYSDFINRSASDHAGVPPTHQATGRQ